MTDMPRVVVLVGGVGGARLVDGLARLLPPQNLTIIVNTGDDFWHYGLRVCPDLDTVMYTLAGVVDPVNGWGREADSTITLSTLREFGENPWFRLGDRDLATHLLRTSRWREGERLTRITVEFANALGIGVTLLPMTDDVVATRVTTLEHGDLDFQDYFVRYRWQPTVTALHYDGADTAALTSEVRECLQNADVVLFGPSNPWLSIAPILAVQGMRDLLTGLDALRIAVTPIIEGQAVKGPAAKLMRELGYEVSAAAVASYYGDLLNGFVYDVRDGDLSIDTQHSTALDTLMRDGMRRVGLARELLNWMKDIKK